MKMEKCFSLGFFFIKSPKIRTGGCTAERTELLTTSGYGSSAGMEAGTSFVLDMLGVGPSMRFFGLGFSDARFGASGSRPELTSASP